MSKIVPVIHCIDWNQIKYNLDICNRNGIDMVFLINHSSSQSAVDDLKEYFRKSKKDYPSIKIGLKLRFMIQLAASVNELHHDKIIHVAYKL